MTSNDFKTNTKGFAKAKRNSLKIQFRAARESLTSLKTLNLTGTSVTEKGVQELQKALPDCTITFKSIGR